MANKAMVSLQLHELIQIFVGMHATDMRFKVILAVPQLVLFGTTKTGTLEASIIRAIGQHSMDGLEVP
jgi:hypothetical protein